MLKRNASLAAAYAAVDQAFKTYKKKVEAKFGKDAVLDAIVSVADEDLTKDEMTLGGHLCCRRSLALRCYLRRREHQLVR